MARSAWHGFIVAALSGLLIAGTAIADDSPLPERRLSLMANTDMPGGDLAQLFDTTLQACIQACAGNAECRSLTYNERARACFPKAEAGAPTPFDGAISGYAVSPSPEAVARAIGRAGAAPFLTADDLSSALTQARTFAAMQRPLPASGSDRAEIRSLEYGGNLSAATQLLAAYVARDDLAQDWVDLARMTLRAEDGSQQAASAAQMALNG